MSVILKAENISKQYRLGLVGTGTLSDDLKRWWYNVRGKEDPFLQVGAVNARDLKANQDYVWALRDINFEVKQGEVLGIIGKNGAGKSTLLKLLSRVTSPTTGRIRSKGRIASLLEIGTGFHPELTGRENIFMNGAVLGMTRAEIKNKLDEIIAFSGCEMYIDTPVKRYSSGMTVRLGFAVAAHLEPEILVVDEVLAVGDADFQKKAIGKMQDLSTGEGRTVLFVSHNMSSVRNLCTRALLLINGKIEFQGETREAIDLYLNPENTGLETGKVNYTEGTFKNNYLRLLEVTVSDSQDRIRTTFSQSEEITIKIKFQVLKRITGLRFNLKIMTQSREDVFVTSSHEITKDGLEEGLQMLQTKLPSFLFNTKRYILSLNAGIPGQEIVIEPLEVLCFEILNENAGGSNFIEEWPGIVSPKIPWEKL